jgi:hypothetical protein
VLSSYICTLHFSLRFLVFTIRSDVYFLDRRVRRVAGAFSSAEALPRFLDGAGAADFFFAAPFLVEHFLQNQSPSGISVRPTSSTKNSPSQLQTEMLAINILQ